MDSRENDDLNGKTQSQDGTTTQKPGLCMKRERTQAAAVVSLPLFGCLEGHLYSANR